MRTWPWFVLAGAVLVAGFAAAGVYTVSQLERFDAGMKRVAIPGSATVELDKAGTYTVFFEQEGAAEGVQPPPGLGVVLASPDSGMALTLVKPTGQTTYSIGNHSGTAIYVVTLGQPGRYRVTASLPGGRTAPGSGLAISFAGVGSVFKAVGNFLAISGVSLGIAAAIVAFALWRQSKARKAAAG